MLLIDEITNHIKDAMKARQSERLDVLRFLKSMLIENKTAKAPVAELDVVVRHQKKLKESWDSFPAGSEQRAKLEREMEVLKAYLPQELSEEEVLNMIREIRSKLAAANPGMIMKELSPQIKGRFDGKRANELVKAELGI